ncbi:MAG: dTDP-4-dehydrorhamnose reductase [Flavobacteriales bacterium]
MENRLKVIVLGSSGQLGRQIVDRLKLIVSIDCTSLTRADLDISDAEMVRHVLDEKHPDVVINCAAYTAVDKAEQDSDQAFLVNANNARTLGLECKVRAIWLLHFSTDYVFNGKGEIPYNESDQTNPISVYGASKLAGEKAILEEHAGACVLRTSWLYGDEGNNFVNTMIRLGRTKKEINVVDDQVSSPTYVSDLVDCTLNLIEVGLTSGKMPAGLLHFSNSGETSWCEFAKAIMISMQLDCTVKPISTKDFGALASRPIYSKLDCTLIENNYGITNRPWQDGLEDCLSKKKKNGNNYAG